MTQQPATRFIDELQYATYRSDQIILTGEIDHGTVSYVNYTLHGLDKKSAKPVLIRMFSGGGLVYAGLSVYDRIVELTRNRPVHILAGGVCMSMALILMQAATKRISLPNTAFMLHELHGGSIGSLSTQQTEIAEAERMQKVLDSIVEKRSGMDVQKIRKALKGTNLYMDAQQALKYKLIDEIMEG